MKIQITQAGWAGYTGHLGAVEFVDGVSVEDLGKGDIQAIAAIVQVEEFKDGAGTGFNPSIAQVIVDTHLRPADVVPSRAGAPAGPAAPGKVYTAEELAVIADKEGIKGLRAVAPEGVKGKSIAELIGDILRYQEDKAAKERIAAEEAAKAAAVTTAATGGPIDPPAGAE